MDIELLTQLWIPVFLMIFAYSFLHSENPLYRVAEYAFVGGMAGHYGVTGILSVQQRGINPLLRGDLTSLIPLILGVLMFFTLFKRHYWPGRYPTALLVGVGVGISLVTFPQANIFTQIGATAIIISHDPFETFDNIVVLLSVVTAVTYFFFTREQKGPLGVSGRLGRLFLMAAFGASYGAMVLGQVSVLLGQVQFLLAASTVAVTVAATLLSAGVLAYLFARQRK